MVEWFDSWARALGPLGALVFGLAALIEYVFPPFPGDTVVVVGGMYAVRGEHAALPLFAAITVGSTLGMAIAYAGGLWLGTRLEQNPETPLPLGVTVAKLKQLEARMRSGGWPLLLANRFVPAFRSLFFVAAGAARMPWLKVLGLGALSALAWNGLLVTVGGVFGGNAEAMERWVMRYQQVALGAIGLVGLALAARLWWKQGRSRAQ